MSVDAEKLPPELESPFEQGRIMPLEIIEEILLYLPVKSLRRFATVSKSWKSMIFNDKFIRRHKIHASLSGEERILINNSAVCSPTLATTRPLLSPSSSWWERPIFPPEDQRFVKLTSYKDKYWCVEFNSSLLLWNCSLGKFEKLSPPFFEPRACHFAVEFLFEMGFDCINHDYKILKIPKSINSPCLGSELYSLRNNSWRKIQPFPAEHNLCSKCVFFCNAFHWMTDSPSGATLISFDLLSKKYSEVGPPPFDPRAVVELSVLREKLCLHLNYHTTKRFVLWEMQKYGDKKSWMKLCDIDVWSVVVPITLGHGKITLTPLILNHNGMVLMDARTLEDATTFMYKDEQSKVEIVCRTYV